MKKLKQLIHEIFINPTNSILSTIAFLLGILAINLISDGIAVLISCIDLRHGIVLITAGISIIILAFLFRIVPSTLLRRSSQLEIHSNVRRRKGIIVMASMGFGISSAKAAIEHHLGEDDGKHKLDHVKILAGPGEGENSSLAKAAELKTEYEEKGISVEIIPLKNADDPTEAFNKTKQAINDLHNIHNLALNEIIADYTGGTKSMTAGMFMACYAQGCALRFMKPTKYTEDGRADIKQKPVATETIFSVGNP